MDTDFCNPSLEILHKIRKSCKTGVFDELKTYFVDNEVGYLYRSLCKIGAMPDDQKTYEEIIKKNDEHLKSIESTEDEEKKINATREKLIYLSEIGDLDRLSDLSNEAEMNTSLKMDVILCEIRLGLILKRNSLVYESINKGIKLIEKDCDWDRRNKFKVYQGLYHMLKCEYKKAADLFASTLATFQCTELFSYEDFVNYTIFCSLISFDRKSLDEKILKSTDVIEVKNKCEKAYGLVQALQSCYYDTVFLKMTDFCTEFNSDVFIGERMMFFMEEIKIRVYNQLLESYSSIRLNSMAEAFCVSEEYLENDLNQFIVNERLNCMLDKVDNMVLVRECERSFIDKIGDLSNQVLNCVEKQANK